MPERLPPLTALRAFEAAARHASFVKAAEELAVTPAAISQQVRQLEAILGIALFRRLARGLELTEAARACMPEMRRGFAHLARAVEDMRGGGLSGRLVVTIIPSFGTRWLVPRLGSFVEAYPDIDVTVIAELRNADLTREDVDVGLRYGKGIYPGLSTTLVLTEDVFPVCAPSLLNGPKPLRRLADLRHHTLLHDHQLSGEEPSLHWRQWLRDAGLADMDPERGPSFSDSVMMMEAAVRGMGVALGRSALASDDLAAGRLVRPLPVSRPADYAYYAVTLEGRERNPRVRAFLTWLQAQATASRAIITGG